LASVAVGDGEYARLKDPAYLELLAAVTTVYDIGLLVILPVAVMKPCRLDADETAVVRGHTTTGSEVRVGLAAGNPSGLAALSIAAEVVRSHHQRWDGTGYPDGSLGSAIPLSGRVVAVVSVYEAMRSSRPYRRPFSHTRAVRFIAAESGSQFDPALQAAFVASAVEFDKVCHVSMK
jgi:response regulator RpfG family c-di-GMP phosphodiesterase